ncbi:hypothetical protein PQQ96_23795 [Paraburkholderia sediminicola]|uniref:hypothetical protein n=1 Tax=Paraburkholderia sediminicola TaxID=458836 RepID=UPI0038BA8EC9
MQVFAHLPLKTLRSVRGRRQSNYHSAWFNAVRLIGPERLEFAGGGSRGRGYILAHVEVPDDLRDHLEQGGFNKDGSYRAQVATNTHRKTLAPFLASGDLEWDVREKA